MVLAAPVPALVICAIAPIPRVGEPGPDVGDVGRGAAAGVGRGDDGVTSLKHRRSGRIELHAVGDELEHALVAHGVAQARDETSAHLPQHAAPDLADVVHLVELRHADGAAWIRAVAQIAWVESMSPNVSGLCGRPLRPVTARGAYGKRRMP